MVPTKGLSGTTGHLPPPPDDLSSPQKAPDLCLGCWMAERPGSRDTGKQSSGQRAGRVQHSRQRAERTAALLLGADPGSGLSATTRHQAFLKLEL